MSGKVHLLNQKRKEKNERKKKGEITDLIFYYLAYIIVTADKLPQKYQL